MAVNIGPQLQAMLERYGLGSLAPWISQRITAAASPEQIELEMYDRPEFINRFPAIRIRGREGLNPLSVDEYLQYEATARQTAVLYGVNVTQEEINKLLAGNVSVQEMQGRLDLASRAALQSDSKTREELNRLYGISGGDLVRYWLDPKETAVSLQRKFATAEIGGQAKRSGYQTELDRGQLGFLVNQGMTAESATEAFGTLVQSEELFEAVDDTELDIDVNDQLRLVTGDEGVGEEVRKRAGKRVAKFQEGGSFSSGQTGVAGLGKATS